MPSDTSLLHRNPSTEHNQSTDFCIDPADLHVGTSGTSAPSNRRISVLPAIDIADGNISFALPSGWQEYFYPEPATVAAALQQAIRPAQWNPYLEVLTITVASVVNRAGKPTHFSLTPLVRR